MRSLSATLLAAQKAMKAIPYVRIIVGSYTFEAKGLSTDRIISYTHEEDPFSDRCTILLSNNDGYFTNLSLEGCAVTLGQGFVTVNGNEYSNKPPLHVISQTFVSSEGGLFCQLNCAGMCSDLAMDEANAVYIDSSTDGVTIKTQITGILAATLAPYTHCPARAVTWGTLDNLIDAVKLKKNFEILLDGTRLASVKRLLAYTWCTMIPTSDNTFKIFNPIISGTTYDYQYGQASHIFDQKSQSNRIVIPNHVIVRTPSGVLPVYTGEYLDSTSISKYRDIQYFKEITALVSNAQAVDIAHAILGRYQMEQTAAGATVPVNVGQELFDYIKITDSRESSTVVGNVGYIHTTYSAQKNEFHMVIGLGGWRAPLDSLIDTASAQDMVLGTLTLNPINLDFVQDGISYKRVQSGALNAAGLVLLDQVVGGTYQRTLATQLSAGKLYLSDQCVYASGYNPSTKESTIPKQSTAPSNPALYQLWDDTSTTPNVLKYWNGSAWISAGVANLDQLPNGTSFHRVASASLTAEGLVLLDQVSIGTTYGLVSKTDISSGHIKLSSTVQDSSHHTVSDTDIATWNAKPNNMDQVADGSTYARVRGSDLSAGYIMLYSGTIKAGVWYDEGGVKIDVSTGIALYGPDAIRFFYGSTLQGYIGVDASNFNIFGYGSTKIWLMCGGGMVIPALSSAPVATDGCGYYDTSTKTAMIYTNGSWHHWQY